MSNHLLVKLSTRKPFSIVPTMPEESHFDHVRGVWLNGDEELISYESKFGTQVTKKCDVETGEDQKGE